MKYCTKCGNQMADDMKFCPNCGTKSEPWIQPMQEAPQSAQQPVNQPVKKQGKIRTSMKVWMIVCFVFATIYGLISIGNSETLFMVLFFLVLGVMFLLLGISPKESKYMFGKNDGMKKSRFVTICVIVAFAIAGIVMSVTMPETPPDDDTVSSQYENVDSGTENNNSNIDTNKDDNKEDNKDNGKDNSNNSEVVDKTEEKTTMSDVQKWYEGQIPAVSQALTKYAKSVDGLTVLNVNSSKFRFGEDAGWYDCHYTFTFTCKVNGVSYSGEARAFMKYNDNTVNWFHFEIFSNNSVTSIVEHYDDSYDKIIEDYYKELERKYK